VGKRYILGAVPILLASSAYAQSAPAPAPAPQPIIEDPCKSRDADDILVCGNRQADKAYRLPPLNEGFDPWGTVESVSRERHQLLGPETAGNGSCSTVGAGGWTGCDIANIKKAEQMGRRIGVGTARFRVGVQPERQSPGGPPR
jgi:hypothetical protein